MRLVKLTSLSVGNIFRNHRYNLPLGQDQSVLLSAAEVSQDPAVLKLTRPRLDDKLVDQISDGGCFVRCEKNPTPCVHNNLEGAGLDGGDFSYVIVVVKVHNLQYKNQFGTKTNRDDVTV